MSEVSDGYRTASSGSTVSEASNATATGDIVAMEQHSVQQTRNGPKAFEGPRDFERTERPIAYLNLWKNHVQQWKAEEIVPAITFENPSELIPKLVQPISEDCLLIVFKSFEQRDLAAQRKLSAFNLKLALDVPKTTVNRTLYLHWMNPFEDDGYVLDWLAKQGWKPISDLQMQEYLNTKTGEWVQNGTRSVVVEVPKLLEIPGFSLFPSQEEGRMVKIRIHYRGIATWCKRCLCQGHPSWRCPADTRPSGSTMKQGDRRWEKQPVVQHNEGTESALAGEHETMDAQTTVRSATVEPETALEDLFIDEEQKNQYEKFVETYEDNVEPFFSKADHFSNFFPSTFTLPDDTTKPVQYNCTEQYLFAQRANQMEDAEAHSRIMVEKNPAKIKRIGEAINWSGSKKEWRSFAMDALRTANIAKYGQNKELRHYLFRTDGLRLAEASKDRFWGCGHVKLNPTSRKPKKWNGCNAMGDMLTVMREKLMDETDNLNEFASEAKEIRELLARAKEQRQEIRPRTGSMKRQRTDDSGLSPDNQKQVRVGKG